MRICHDCGSRDCDTEFPKRKTQGPYDLLCEDCLLERGRAARRAAALQSRQAFLTEVTFARRARQTRLFLP